MSRTRATPSSTPSPNCQEPGPGIRRACQPRTCQRASPSRPSHNWRSAWSSGRSRRACHLPGSRPNPSTAWARSSWRCGGPTRVMVSASRASTHSGPGGPRPRYRARPRRSRQPSWGAWGAEAEVSGTAEEIATALVEEDWIRLSAGAGTKGPRLYDWAYLELASLKADALDPTLDPTLDQSLWTRGLLVRRSLSDGSLAYFTTWCPACTPIQELVAVEGRRWAIEDAFETAKTELG